MSIGTRLRQLRKANKLSGDKFGELCGVTKGMVSQWESDQSPPSTDRLIDLRKHIDFSFDWLLNGDEQRTSYTTSDPTLVKMLQALEPRAEYLKEAAYKAVVNTCEAVDQAKAGNEAGNTTEPIQKRVVNAHQRRREMDQQAIVPALRKKHDAQ